MLHLSVLRHLVPQSSSLESGCQEEHCGSDMYIQRPWIFFSTSGHSILGDPLLQTPLGTSSIPSNEALGQDSPGSSRGKHLEAGSLVKAPSSVHSSPGPSGDMCGREGTAAGPCCLSSPTWRATRGYHKHHWPLTPTCLQDREAGVGELAPG